MDLKEIYNKDTAKEKIISFEVFPPKGEFDPLISELKLLKKFNPSLVSVTSTSSVTNEVQNTLVGRILEESGLNVMPHITCARNSREDVNRYLSNLKNVAGILALRGDLPTDGSQACCDFKYANELVEYVKARSALSVAVAGYPEGHIESNSIEADIKNLKKKVLAGGEVIFTQLFFDADLYLRYVEKVRAAGIDKVIIPGIMPIMSYKQISKMTSLAGIFVPSKMSEKIELYKDDKVSMREYGIEFTTKLCEKLLKNGVEGIHFYTLNHAYSVGKIL